MKYLPYSPISAAAASATTTSAAIDMSQIYKMSAQVIVSAGTSLGTLQPQVSNDHANGAQMFENQTFTNWSNLGSSVAVSAAGATLIAQQDMCYKALRFVYTDTFVNISQIVAVADVAGSLNSTYFLASSISGNFYFWFSDGGGIDPAVAGRTAIPVAFTTNDTAATIGGLIRTAAAAHGWTVTGATTTAILTNTVAGPSTPASDGAAATGFAITNTQPTSSISVNILCLSV